jgi:hypothetical protein
MKERRALLHSRWLLELGDEASEIFEIAPMREVMQRSTRRFGLLKRFPNALKVVINPSLLGGGQLPTLRPGALDGWQPDSASRARFTSGWPPLYLIRQPAMS